MANYVRVACQLMSFHKLHTRGGVGVCHYSYRNWNRLANLCIHKLRAMVSLQDLEHGYNVHHTMIMQMAIITQGCMKLRTIFYNVLGAAWLTCSGCNYMLTFLCSGTASIMQHACWKPHTMLLSGLRNTGIPRNLVHHIFHLTMVWVSTYFLVRAPQGSWLQAAD